MYIREGTIMCWPMDFQWIGENFCTYPANRCYVQSSWTPQKCLRRTHFPETADPSAPGVRVHRVTSVQSHDLYHTVKLNTSVLHEKGRFVPFRIPSCTEGNSYRHFSNQSILRCSSRHLLQEQGECYWHYCGLRSFARAVNHPKKA